MKQILNKTFISGVMFVMLLFIVNEAYAARHVIAISPVQHPARLEQHKAKILDYALSYVGTGDSLLLIDAYNIRVIGEFAVPDSDVYQHPRAKLNVNRTFVAALRQFSAQREKERVVAEAVNLPRLMEFLGSNYAPFDASRMLLIGSPIYVHPTNAAITMQDKQWFEDGAFNLPQSQSSFSLQGRENTVPAPIHWLTNDALALEDGYIFHVKRMYTLYLEGHGATLASFDRDDTTVWDRFINNAKAAPHAYRLGETQKMGIGKITPKQAQHTTLPSIHERQLSAVKLEKSMLRQAHKVEIGISWDCTECDLDLHVRPHRGAAVLSYANRVTPEGFYHKDYTQSPETENGYETVSFTSAVDIEDLLLAVNIHSGSVRKSAITGEIRLAIGDHTYGLPFSFDESRGNGGAEREVLLSTGRAPNDHWVVIDPIKILGL